MRAPTQKFVGFGGESAARATAWDMKAVWSPGAIFGCLAAIVELGLSVCRRRVEVGVMKCNAQCRWCCTLGEVRTSPLGQSGSAIRGEDKSLSRRRVCLSTLRASRSPPRSIKTQPTSAKRERFAITLWLLSTLSPTPDTLPSRTLNHFDERTTQCCPAASAKLRRQRQLQSTSPTMRR